MFTSRFILLLIAFASLAIPTLAQDELTETYLAPDESFTFRYPVGWEISESEGIVTLTSPTVGDAYAVVLVYSPAWVAQSAGEVDTTLATVEALDYVFDKARGEPEVTALGGRDVAVVQIENETQKGAAWVVPLSEGRFGMIQALSQPGEFEDYVDTVEAMVLTLDTPSAADASSATSPQTIASFDDEWEAVVGELESQQLIAFGGSLVFHEDETFFEGQGTFFTPLARNQPFPDVVVAGELSFTASDPEQLETCSLLARVGEDANGDAETFIDIGFATGGDLFVQDRFSATEDSFVETIPLSLDLSEPHHLLLILIDDLLDVYVDGELKLDDFLVADRTGTFGIVLRSVERGARCEGRNVWVYQTPVFTPGLCEISGADAVNMRSGPGTSFDRAGRLAAGTIVRAEGVATDTDGFQWWLLENGNWVREDVVRAQGDCADLPVTQ